MEHKDASKVDSTDGPLAVPVTDELLNKLLRTVASCGRPCPEETELRALLASSHAQVAAVALQIMADPTSRTDQGVGQMSMLVVEDWLKLERDKAALDRASKALERVAAEGSSFMHTKAYEFLAQFALPDAQRVLIAEIENPERDVRERDLAARSLGLLIDDFDLLRRWLRDDQPLHWEAALSMMKTFEDFNDANKPLWAEGRDLLVALGKRPELPAAVVYDLAFYYDFYIEDNDAEVLALAKRWAKHPDDMAAGQMIKILP